MGGWQATLGSPGQGGVSINLAQNLRTAAAQQAKLAAQQQQQDFQDELELRKAGAVPYEPLKAQPNADPHSLTRRSPNPAQQDIDRSRIVTMRDGRQWVMPDKSQLTPEQQNTQQHQSTGDLLSALREGARPVSPSAMDPAGTVQQNGDIPRMLETADPNDPNAQSQLVPEARSGVNLPVSDQPGTAFSAGGKQLYMPTDAEKSEQALREKTSQASAMQDAEGWVLPDSLARAAAKHAGLPEDALIGVKLPHETVSEAFKSASGPEKQDTQNPLPGYVGPKGGPLVRDTKTGKVNELDLPAGSKPALTEEQKARKSEFDTAEAERRANRDGRESDRIDRATEALQTKVDKSKTDEDQYRQLADSYNSAVGVANGEKYIDPMDKTRTPKIMTPEKRTAMAQAYMRYKTKADDLAKQGADYSKQIESRQAKRTPQGQQAPAPAGGPPTRAGQTPGPTAAPGQGAQRQPTSVSSRPIGINRKLPPSQGDREHHQGRDYVFNGKVWVGQ
jgi:hypothetical protein